MGADFARLGGPLAPVRKKSGHEANVSGFFHDALTLL